MIDEMAPQLLDEVGISYTKASQILLSWSHQGQCHSEAAFARLAGVAPIPASSGQITRHRLSRGCNDCGNPSAECARRIPERSINRYSKHLIIEGLRVKLQDVLVSYL